MGDDEQHGKATSWPKSQKFKVFQLLQVAETSNIIQNTASLLRAVQHTKDI